MSNPTKSELAYWDRAASFGCIACRIDGIFNPIVSVHHSDGRTKPGCHKKIFCLCAGHHQNGTGNDKTLIAVHPFKHRFEERYGSSVQLVEMTYHLVCGGEP